MVYHSLVYSQLLYGILSWGSASATALHPLCVIQNNIMRLMSFSDCWRSTTLPIYKRLKLLRIGEVAKMELSTFMYKYETNNLPNIFRNYFISEETIHDHFTRRVKNKCYHFPRVQSEMGKTKLAFRGIKIWDEINNDTKKLSLHQFKNKLKEQYLGQYN